MSTFHTFHVDYFFCGGYVGVAVLAVRFNLALHTWPFPCGSPCCDNIEKEMLQLRRCSVESELWKCHGQCAVRGPVGGGCCWCWQFRPLKIPDGFDMVLMSCNKVVQANICLSHWVCQRELGSDDSHTFQKMERDENWQAGSTYRPGLGGRLVEMHSR